jgi:hypothetical protein
MKHWYALYTQPQSRAFEGLGGGLRQIALLVGQSEDPGGHLGASNGL